MRKSRLPAILLPAFFLAALALPTLAQEDAPSFYVGPIDSEGFRLGHITIVDDWLTVSGLGGLTAVQGADYLARKEKK